MNTNHEIQHSCNEKFAELCALSTTGSLTDDELKRLEHHLLSCGRCRVLLAEYQSLTTEGVAKLAAEVVSVEEVQSAQHHWGQDEAKKRFFSELGTREPGLVPMVTGPIGESVGAVPGPVGFNSRSTTMLPRVAAVFVLGVFGAYQIGVYKTTRAGTTQRPVSDVETSSRRQLGGALKERAALDEQLGSSAKSIQDLSDRVTLGEKELAQLKSLNASLERKDPSTGPRKSVAIEFVRVGVVTARLAGRGAHQDSGALQTVREELNRLRDVRQKDLQLTANLETEIKSLSAQLRERGETIDQQGQLLASDRDIRELMGARQLYIADVLDVGQDGRTRKPYGRIFCTKDKSLHFLRI